MLVLWLVLWVAVVLLLWREMMLLGLRVSLWMSVGMVLVLLLLLLLLRRRLMMIVIMMMCW